MGTYPNAGAAVTVVAGVLTLLLLFFKWIRRPLPSVAAGASAVSATGSSPASSAPASAGAVDNVPRLGMTVRRLRLVVDEKADSQQALAGLTTEQVKDLVFLPLTAATQLSLCEQLQAEGDDGIGIATWFVSHAWMCTFVELLEALEHFFAGEPQGLDTVIWLDLVSTSQHGTFTRAPEWWRQTFKLAIQSMGSMVMVMAPWDKPVTLTRAWCILELYACCSSGCRFEVALPQAQRAQLARDLMYKNGAFFEFLANVHSESSDCSRETDRDSIFAAVRASVGFAGLDAIVRRTLESWMLRLLRGKIDEARAVGNELDTAGWLNALGILYWEQRMNDDAVCVLEEAVEICQRVLGSEHETCLAYKNSLTGAYHGKSDHVRAKALIEEVLAAYRRVHGAEHERTLTAMSNLAASYVSTDEFARALPLTEEALAVRRRVLGDEHEDTLISLLNSALACYQQGDLARAELKFDEVRPIMRRVLGEQHPFTLCADFAFVLLLLRTGRVSQAQPLAATTCSAFTSVLGPSHPDAIGSVFVVDLAAFYAGGMDERGLAAAWRTCCDRGGGARELGKEYEAALAARA